MIGGRRVGGRGLFGAPRAAALLLLGLGGACNGPSGPSTSSTAPDGGPPDAQPQTGPAYVRITRGVHPAAALGVSLGPLDPAKRIENLSLVFRPSAEQLADRDALLQALTSPGSPEFHKWLTPESYAARFGAKPADVARAVAWLTSEGLTVHPTPSRLGARVTFSGTVAQIERAFHAQMNRYLVRGETHYAMADAPAVPSELADIVLGVHNTHDFYPTTSKPRFKVIPSATCPPGGFCSGNGIAPPDWATIYDVTPLYTTGVAGTKITGSGVTIAIVGITEISQTDLTAFRTRYGLASNPITMTLVPGTGAAQADNGAGIEAVLDTEWAGGIAPDATINYVYTGANDGNVDDATYYAIEQNSGAVLSESWGGCEQGYTLSDADVLQVFGSAASLLGITYVAASGDAGAAACQGTGGLWVNMPAAYPGVTAVGGTGFAIPGGLTFDASGNVTGEGTEAVWNEFHDAYSGSGVAAGGGGISSIFTRPSYQSTISTCAILGSLPSGVTASAMRQIPDVALTAASGSNQYGYFIECTLDAFGRDCDASGSSPNVIEIGGTSASTPSFAGVMALANQATGGRLGNVNPLLYTLASSAPTALRDVTTGNNEVTCRPTDPGCPSGKLYGYAATSGYDCASGLGSIDANNLVTAWATLVPTSTSLSPSTTTTSEGSSVTLTATVDVLKSDPDVLGGTVTFTFQSYLANGDPDLSWTLGTAAVSGTMTSGTATLSVAIPPGLVKPGEAVDVVALYGGDAHHLASGSAKTSITFSPVATLCDDPATTSVAAGKSFTFTSGGGVPPVRWYIDFDSTCTSSFTKCSTLNETTGAFVAGTGAAGYVLVQAVDADGAEVFSEVTVGSPSGTAPWAGDAGILTNECCTPIASCPAGDNCGTIPDGCGGTVSCGPACSGGDVCVSNVCVPSLDSGPGDSAGAVDTGSSGSGSDSAGGIDTGSSGSGTDSAGGVDTGSGADSGGSDASGIDGSSGVDVGSGTDAGGVDSSGGTDSGSGPDAGSSGTDSGSGSDTGSSGTDSGSGSDAGSSGTDAGSGTDTGSGADAGSGTDTGPMSDAADGGSGADGGSTDGATTADSGIDAGTVADSGEDGAADSGSSDSGVHEDAGKHDSGKGGHDSGALADSGDAADAGGDVVQGGGCGCRTAKPAPASSSGLAGAGALVVLGGLRTRRRRKRG